MVSQGNDAHVVHGYCEHRKENGCGKAPGRHLHPIAVQKLLFAKLLVVLALEIQQQVGEDAEETASEANVWIIIDSCSYPSLPLWFQLSIQFIVRHEETVPAKSYINYVSNVGITHHCSIFASKVFVFAGLVDSST